MTELVRRHYLVLLGGIAAGSLVGILLARGSLPVTSAATTIKELKSATTQQVVRVGIDSEAVPGPTEMQAVEFELGHDFTLNVADPKLRMVYTDDWLSGASFALRIDRSLPTARNTLEFRLDFQPWDKEHAQFTAFFERFRPGHDLRLFYRPGSGDKHAATFVSPLGIVALTHWTPGSQLRNILLRVVVSQETTLRLLELRQTALQPASLQPRTASMALLQTQSLRN